MKFESEDVKRQFLGFVAKICSELFSDSKYPHQAFNFPFHGVPEDFAYPIIELHIRMPANFSRWCWNVSFANVTVGT